MTEDAPRKIGKVAWLALCMTFATIALTFLGYRSTREWLQTTRISVKQHGHQVLALLVTALNHDMKGAHISTLVPISQSRVSLDQPYDMADRFAHAFARFPYPESFFLWEDSQDTDGVVYFFNRSDRLPLWRQAYPLDDRFPVVIDRNPPSMVELVLAARQRAMSDIPFAVFETNIQGVPYQILVQFIYHPANGSPKLSGLVGFTVNLRWVREHYFEDLINQISGIGGRQNNIELTILDDAGRLVTGGRLVSTEPADEIRHFQMIFADRALLLSLPVSQRPYRRWTAQVNVGNNSSLGAVGRSTDRALWLLAVASILTIAALVIAVHAAREAAQLAAVKSAFLSSVSHEMKTPLSLIRLASDTLVKGRYTSKDTIEEYTRMLAFEADQLTRLIDNVLSYVRIADSRSRRTFELLDITELVEESLTRFRLRLKELGFTVNLHLPAEIHLVRGDRALLLQLIENLIDNAIKYAATGQVLDIKAWNGERAVHVEVSDRGPGIPRNELPRVCDKFFRGSSARERGSGLGLSIAKQVVEDHGGKLDIRSDAGQGTAIRISLPVSAV